MKLLEHVYFEMSDDQRERQYIITIYTDVFKCV